jgi:hypothetical protein
MMDFTIPHSMEVEHEELERELRKGTREGGETEEAAKKVARIMHPHFVKEEDFALPPLGLLPLLSKGRVTPDMKDILLMTDMLKTELNQMLKEHRQILTALKRLVSAAKKERKPEYVRFADRLTLHAKAEEELYYPAAILVGEYVKLKLRK